MCSSADMLSDDDDDDDINEGADHRINKETHCNLLELMALSI